MNIRIVVLGCLMLCVVAGCGYDAQFAKGPGSLYERHTQTYVGKAAVTNRVAVNPLGPNGEFGPAVGTAQHPTIDPNIGHASLFGPGPASNGQVTSGMLDSINPQYFIPVVLIGIGIGIGKLNRRSSRT